VLDYHWINTLLGEWGQEMLLHCGSNDKMIFFTDGKPWKMSQTGMGRAVRLICEDTGLQ
jgi:hypothetical protein